MARATPPSSSGITPLPAVNRVTKSSSDRLSTRSTRQRSRFLSEASSTGVLQRMVDEADQAAVGASASNSTHKDGKIRDIAQEPINEEFEDWIMIDEVYRDSHPCPVTDKDMNPFRLMDLPTEIRLEIYRACLTRPYNILLSKKEQPPLVELENAEGTDLIDGEPLLDDHHTTAPLPVRTTTSRAPRFRHLVNNRSSGLSIPEPERKQTADPLLVNVLRASKEIYKEARGVFYSENVFTLDLNTAMSTLSCLHQRSRRQIKHLELEIPTYNEILERFQETVRLSLRYCSGLKRLRINMPFTLPGADGSGTTGNTTVYANGFDILRWLPQECSVELTGNICMEIERVVNKHLQLAKTLDKLAYARRQLISNENGPSTTLSHQLH